MRVLIVDDHALLRRGIKQLVEMEFQDAKTLEATSMREAIAMMHAHPIDVVLLDLGLPDATGLDGLFTLKRCKQDLAILIVSMDADERLALRALKAGATGYMTKDRTPEELIDAIKKVRAGKRYLSPTIAEKIAVGMIDGSDSLTHERLSQQEYRIMCLIAQGKTPREIAEQLFLSVKTVSTYRGRIFSKMLFKNNAELTHYCIKHQLVG